MSSGASFRRTEESIKKVVFALLILLILLVGLIVGAFFIGQTLVDIFLIITALFSFIAFAALGYAGLQVVRLVKEVRGEVTGLVDSARETLAEVQGTARFVNESVVSPVAQAAGFVGAVRGAVKAFTEPLFRRSNS